jgi:hypothetical protein
MECSVRGIPLASVTMGSMRALGTLLATSRGFHDVAYDPLGVTMTMGRTQNSTARTFPVELSRTGGAKLRFVQGTKPLASLHRAATGKRNRNWNRTESVSDKQELCAPPKMRHVEL